jgi:hypothetical protein
MRIVSNIAASDIRAEKRFYQDRASDGPWLDRNLGLAAADGGSDQRRDGRWLRDLSIQVDDVDAALRAMKAAGFPIEYTSTSLEASAASTCALFGKIVNILAHRDAP